MLAFRINYLRGVVQAADVSAGQKKDVVEWPPHPDRLFSALVQAWGDLGEPEDARQALYLLEKEGPPWIQAGDLLSVSALPRYVPVNDSLKGGSQIQGTGLCRDRKARLFPHSSLEVPGFQSLNGDPPRSRAARRTNQPPRPFQQPGSGRASGFPGGRSVDVEARS
jgi:CRISPR-associated protein Csb2